mgnify:CR=1 FL=1
MTGGLTVEQVAAIKRLWPEHMYCPWDELLASHEKLREELSEARSDVRALALILTKIERRALEEMHTHSDVANCMWDPFACDITDTMHSALARPGVAALLEKTEGGS